MWKHLGSSGADEELFHRLIAGYSAAHRKYHTMQHLEECLAFVDQVGASREVELALWFHDAIYDTKRKDNEQRSAEWASESVVAAGLSEEQARRVYELIMATMHDAVPVGGEAEVLVDIDLGILGAEVARFGEYEVQVREEYAWVPEPLYRAARRQVLEGFVARERIYSTEYFYSNYEARARENIARSLARL